MPARRFAVVRNPEFPRPPALDVDGDWRITGVLASCGPVGCTHWPLHIPLQAGVSSAARRPAPTAQRFAVGSFRKVTDFAGFFGEMTGILD